MRACSYIPQGINAAQRISFENCDDAIRFSINNCGNELCGERETMSARIASVYDFDGSLLGSGKPSIVGSHRAWWNDTEVACEFTRWNVWRCDWSKDSPANRTHVA